MQEAYGETWLEMVTQLEVSHVESQQEAHGTSMGARGVAMQEEAMQLVVVPRRTVCR